jgi:hypothetical protein
MDQDKPLEQAPAPASAPAPAARRSHSEFPDIKAPEAFKAIVAVGVSGSGQSQWAKEFAKSQRAIGVKWLVLCRDDLRLDALREHGVPESDIPQAVRDWNYNFSNPDEAKIHGRWLGRARWAVEQCFDGVICADSNLDGGRSATTTLTKHLGIDKANILRKLFDVTYEDAVERDAADQFSVGKAEVTKQFHQLGRSLSLRKALDKAPNTSAWISDPANHFQTPKSLLPKPAKTEKLAKEATAASWDKQTQHGSALHQDTPFQADASHETREGAGPRAPSAPL